jgi:hypothetical protein
LAQATGAKDNKYSEIDADAAGKMTALETTYSGEIQAIFAGLAKTIPEEAEKLKGLLGELDLQKLLTDFLSGSGGEQTPTISNTPETILNAIGLGANSPGWADIDLTERILEKIGQLNVTPADVEGMNLGILGDAFQTALKNGMLEDFDTDDVRTHIGLLLGKMDFSTDVTPAGQTAVDGFTDPLETSTKPKSAGGTMAKNAIDGAKDVASRDAYGVGGNIISGIASGITNNDWRIKRALINAVNAGIKSTKEEFGIRSPSKVTGIVLGKPMAQGVGVGFVDEMEKVTLDMQKSMLPNMNNARLPNLALASPTYNNTNSINIQSVTIDSKQRLDAFLQEAGFYMNSQNMGRGERG